MMEKREFRCWGKFKKGWESDEVEEEWKNLKDDLSVERDQKGKNGSLRLEVDKGQQKQR